MTHVAMKRLVGALGWLVTMTLVTPCLSNTDDDPRDEIAIARHVSYGDRVFVYDDHVDSEDALLEIGEGDWGDNRPATAVAWGDVDGDGRDELAYGRDSDTGYKIYVRDDKEAKFALLGMLGSNYGPGRYPSALAFGDFDFSDCQLRLDFYGNPMPEGILFDNMVFLP